MTWWSQVSEFVGRATGATPAPAPLSETQEIKDLQQSRLELSAAATFIRNGFRFELADLERKIINGHDHGEDH